MNTAIIFCAKYLIYVLGIGFLYVGYTTKDKERFVRLTIVTTIVALLIFSVGRVVYDNPRPFVTTGSAPLVAHAPDNGFPSGHSLAAGIMAAVVTIVQPPVGAAFWIGAVLVGAGRVLAGVHHMLDVVASFVIVILSARLAKRVPRLLVITRHPPKS
jgi:undecaprenyl-diphosphatase